MMKNNEMDNKKNIEVWEDLVNIRDLILSLAICLATTFIGYLLAPNEPPMPLFFGLAGAISGFVVSSIIIKPKRVLIDEGDIRK